MKKDSKIKKNRSWLKIIGAILILFIILIGVFAFSVWQNLTSSIDKMHTPIDRQTEKREDELALKEKEPFSVLLLGVDERKGDAGRTDSMVVLTINPKKESIKMVSIPRDTRTEIIGRNKMDKINHAYAFGGIKMSMDTVEHFLNIPIDYYIKINMEGFKDIVDAVGGITVNNTLDFTYGGVHFPVGTITLNGDSALKYSRMRKNDPKGDFGRQTRQRQVIEAIIKEGASISSLVNYKSIFNALSNNIQTNVSFDDIKTIQKNYRTAVKNINHLTIEGNGTKINGIYYFEVASEEKKKLQAELKEHLTL